MRDAVVIGAGLAGLAAALKLARSGAKVTVVTKGIGGLQLGQGTVDILGYSADRRVETPIDAVKEHIASRPTHPYTHFAPEDIARSASWLAQTVGPALLIGDPNRNVVLPTAVGALRPTAYYQPSMAAGIPTPGKKYVIVGLKRLKDFYPSLVADNLARQHASDGSPIEARAETLDFEIRPGEIDTTATNHARAFDDPECRARFVQSIHPLIKDGETVGLPGVLGLNDISAWEDIRNQLGCEIFEIPLQPPSIPGMRLNQMLTELVKRETRFIIGSSIVGFRREHGRITSVGISTAGRTTYIDTRHVVLAAGGFESGALEIDSYMNVTESIFNLPVLHASGQLLHGDFWGMEQPLFLSGVNVDDSMRPLDSNNKPLYDNLYAAGGNLAGATRWREKSGEGIALASALRASETIAEELA